MQALRHASFLARLVLAWFAVSMVVAMASPLVQPQTMELVCSGTGALKLLEKDSDAGAMPKAHGPDCPLCAALELPPGAATVAAPLPAPGCVVQSIPSPRVAAVLAGPLPARGPPLPLFI